MEATALLPPRNIGLVLEGGMQPSSQHDLRLIGDLVRKDGKPHRGYFKPQGAKAVKQATPGEKKDVENVVDFFVSINAMRTFNHPLKRGNHLESELDPQK
jgi:hypothetical protein